MAYSVSQLLFFTKRHTFAQVYVVSLKDNVPILRKQVEADLLKLLIILYPIF